MTNDKLNRDDSDLLLCRFRRGEQLDVHRRDLSRPVPVVSAVRRHHVQAAVQRTDELE